MVRSEDRTRVLERKVVVASRVSAKRRVISERSEVDGCALYDETFSDEEKSKRFSICTLFHRPIIRAPRRSEPCCAVSPSLTMGLSVRNLLNSGTSCLSCRNTRKEPSLAHAGRVAESPVSPTKIVPLEITAWPGIGFEVKPFTAGFEIPSRYPKSGQKKQERLELRTRINDVILTFVTCF